MKSTLASTIFAGNFCKALIICASALFTTTSTNDKATRRGGLVLMGYQYRYYLA